ELIYNGAMWMEVLCAQRDCAMPAVTGRRRKGDLPLCRYLRVPLWTPTRSAAKRFGAELEEQGGNVGPGLARVGRAKARASRDIPTGTAQVGTFRFDAGQVGLHERRQRHPSAFSQLLCG